MMSTYYIETFGCQMNKYDSELVASILNDHGYTPAEKIEDANLILINTCSVREHAETRVKNKIDSYNAYRIRNRNLVIGVLGCMAERIGPSLVREMPSIDFVIGPDSYRRIPEILENLNGTSVVGTHLPEEDAETYSEINPFRFGRVSAWVAIMRGCNNFCSYCIVPYVRGRERSRPLKDIVEEVRSLVDDGYAEVTLLGQNVNSYRHGGSDFPDLMREVSEIRGMKRIRFASSHPKDLSMKLIKTIAERDNICNHIHLAVQSGSNRILKLMNRGYTREHFISIIERCREYLGEPGIWTDIIVGFPGETEEDFEQTLDLVQRLRFDGLFSFKYSPREGTAAAAMEDSVDDMEKLRRLEKLNRVQKEITLQRNQQEVGSVKHVLIEGLGKKKKDDQYMGRTETNKIVVFQKQPGMEVGMIVPVIITNSEGHTLFGRIYQLEAHHVDN